jgi:acid stress-induced BolA-like protein IbaG/YrbA
MATVSKTRLENLLETHLKLKSPRFFLRKADGKFIGSVISDTFKGKTNLQRQRMMWAVLESVLADAAARRVGMLLGYTDDEWDEPLEGMSSARPPAKPRAAKKAG